MISFKKKRQEQPDSSSQIKKSRFSSLNHGLIGIIQNGLIIKLTDLHADELAFLQKSLTFYPPNLFDKTLQTEPILAYKINHETIIIPRMLGMQYYSNSIDQLSDGIDIDTSITFNGQLKPLQNDIANSCIIKIKKPPFGALLTLPCGFGKTVLGLYIAYKLGKRTLIVVHKEFLLTQWKERIISFLPNASIGIIQGKHEENNKDFVIAMVQTLAIREYALNFFDGFGLLICDEVHHFASKTFSSIFFNNRIRYIIGLSATPKRKDGLTELVHYYIGDFAAKIEESTSSAARKCQVVRISFKYPRKRVDEMNQGAIQKFKGTLVLNEKRNLLILNIIKSLAEINRKIIVLSERVCHLEFLSNEFSSLGTEQSCSLYIGATKQKDRASAAQADVIFATFSLASEGLDISALDTLILVTPVSDIVQASGRILRAHDDKKSPLVVDVTDDACTAFERNAMTRLNYYKRCGYAINNYDENINMEIIQEKYKN